MWYRGSDRLDVTVKSGRGLGRELAPTWSMVGKFKRGEISFREYEAMYLERLRKLWVSKRWVFRQLFRMGRVTFVCYCRSDEHCHRRLLREALVKIGERYGIEVVDGGDLKLVLS
jgi:uncharacterized protein YeaO (DUF488 family)